MPTVDNSGDSCVISNTGEVAEFSGNEVPPVLRQRISQHEIFGKIYDKNEGCMPYQEFRARFSLDTSLSHLVATLGDAYEPGDVAEAQSTCAYCTKEAVVQGKLEIAGRAGGSKSRVTLFLCDTHRSKIQKQHPGKFQVVPQD